MAKLFSHRGRVMERVLSGIRATGKLHIGNFLGAVQHFVRYQNKPDTSCLYFIADIHTLTTPYNPDELRGNIVEMALSYIAAGLDPEKSILYAQSSVPEVSQLSLFLSMVQPLGPLEDIPTFKEKLKKFPNNVSLGLITYPVLMAADILGCQATMVPVGEDQVPNIELARDLARKFNARFGDTFTIPKTMTDMVKVLGLDGAKMGKSDADNAIDIDAPVDVIRERYLKKGITDPKRTQMSIPGDPFYGCKSVYHVHTMVTPGEEDDRTIARRCSSATIGCVECKNLLVDNLARILEPYRERRLELASNMSYVRDVLHEGGKKARMIFAETLSIVQDRMGITLY